MFQTKEQEKSPEKQLKEIDEIEVTQIPYAEFKIMVVRTLKDLQGRIDDLSENLSKERVSIKKDIGTIKKNHSEMKNILEGIKSKLYEAEG